MANNGGKPSRGHAGTLVIIGGHEDHDGERVILKEVASRIPDGKLVLATIASHEPAGYLEKYQATFAELGVPHVTELYVDDRVEAALEDKLKVLGEVNAIFFSGGDQLRITSQIGDTPIFDRVHEIYRNGGLIAGTSAGASVMSETMLVRGPNGSSFRIGDLHMAPGLSLLPSVIIDQHFAERGRIGRLIGAVSQNPRVLGIGIDEDTAINRSGIVLQGDRERRRLPRRRQRRDAVEHRRGRSRGAAIDLRPEAPRSEFWRRLRPLDPPTRPSMMLRQRRIWSRTGTAARLRAAEQGSEFPDLCTVRVGI